MQEELKWFIKRSKYLVECTFFREGSWDSFLSPSSNHFSLCFCPLWWNTSLWGRFLSLGLQARNKWEHVDNVQQILHSFKNELMKCKHFDVYSFLYKLYMVYLHYGLPLLCLNIRVRQSIGNLFTLFLAPHEVWIKSAASGADRNRHLFTRVRANPLWRLGCGNTNCHSSNRTISSYLCLRLLRDWKMTWNGHR